MRLTRGRQEAELTENKQPGHSRHQTANTSGHRRAPTVARADAEGATHPHSQGVTRGACRPRLPSGSQPGPVARRSPRRPRPMAPRQALPSRPTRPKTRTQTDHAIRPPRSKTTPALPRHRAEAEGATPPRRRASVPDLGVSDPLSPLRASPRAPSRMRSIGISLGVHAPRGRSEAVTQPRVIAAHALVQRLDRAARRLARRGPRDGPGGRRLGWFRDASRVCPAMTRSAQERLEEDGRAWPPRRRAPAPAVRSRGARSRVRSGRRAAPQAAARSAAWRTRRELAAIRNVSVDARRAPHGAPRRRAGSARGNDRPRTPAPRPGRGLDRPHAACARDGEKRPQKRRTTHEVDRFGTAGPGARGTARARQPGPVDARPGRGVLHGGRAPVRPGARPVRRAGQPARRPPRVGGHLTSRGWSRGGTAA
jgi:hypothetical protein